MDLSKYSVAHFERGAPLAKEIAWQVVRLIFFHTKLPLPSAWRVALLRLFGARIGKGVVVREGVNVSMPWRLRIGDHVWLGEDVMILSLALVTIESSVCVSQRAFLCTGSHDARSETFDLRTAPITLRSGSWVAAMAFIGPGVEIGSGSIVSAGSVALENVPPGMLARGNPAVLKPRS